MKTNGTFDADMDEKGGSQMAGHLDRGSDEAAGLNIIESVDKSSDKISDDLGMLMSGGNERDDAGDDDENKGNTFNDEDSGVPFDRGWAWMITLSCFMVFFVYLGYDQVMAVLLVDIIEELDTSVSIVSIIFAIGSLFYCLATQLSINFLLKYVSNRVLETGAAVVNALATLMFVLVPDIKVLFISCFIKSLAKGVTLIATLTLVGYYFRRRRALATALGLIGCSAGVVAVPPLVRYLREEYGFRGCFALVAGFELHAIIATVLQRPISSYTKRKRQKHEKCAPESGPLLASGSSDQTPLEPQLSSVSRGGVQLSSTTDTNSNSGIIRSSESSEAETNFHSNQKEVWSKLVDYEHDKKVHLPSLQQESQYYEERFLSAEEVSSLESNAAVAVKFNKHTKDSDVVLKSDSNSNVNLKTTSSQSEPVAFLPESDANKYSQPDFGNAKAVSAICLPESVQIEAEESGLRGFLSESESNRTSGVDAILPVSEKSVSSFKNSPTTEQSILCDKCFATPITRDSRSSLIQHSNDGSLKQHNEANLHTNLIVCDTPSSYSPTVRQFDLNYKELTYNSSQFNESNQARVISIVTSSGVRVQIFKDSRSHTHYNGNINTEHSGQLNLITEKTLAQGQCILTTPFNSLASVSECNQSVLPASSISKTEFHDPKKLKTSIQGTKPKNSKKWSWINLLIDVNLLKNILGISVICNYCMVNAGILNAIYLSSYAIKVGVSRPDAALLITISGLMDMVGKIFSGVFADLKIVRPSVIMAVSTFCLGVVTHCISLFQSFEHLVIYSVLQGFLASIGPNLNTVAIVDVMGIQNLGKMLAMCSLFLSIFIAAQHPIQGALIEYTGNFVATFHYVGTIYFVSSLLLLSQPLIRRLQAARGRKNGEISKTKAQESELY